MIIADSTNSAASVTWLNGCILRTRRPGVGDKAIVPQEEVEVEDGELVVRNPVTPHQYVDRRGSDVKEGQVIAKRGEVLRPVKSALMEALGIRRIEVFRRPVVSVISIGSELTDDPEEATGLKTLKNVLFPSELKGIWGK
jgi:molybdopterin biosynthesis enzyme